MTEQHECEHPLSTEEEILDWYKTASNMEKLIFYRAAHLLAAEYETLKKATDALSAEDAKEAKHMAYDINNIPLGNALNAYADILSGESNDRD